MQMKELMRNGTESQSFYFYQHILVPKAFGWINEMCGLEAHLFITWTQDGSHTKHVDSERAGLLKTG